MSFSCPDTSVEPFHGNVQPMCFPEGCPQESSYSGQRSPHLILCHGQLEPKHQKLKGRDWRYTLQTASRQLLCDDVVMKYLKKRLVVLVKCKLKFKLKSFLVFRFFRLFFFFLVYSCIIFSHLFFSFALTRSAFSIFILF